MMGYFHSTSSKKLIQNGGGVMKGIKRSMLRCYTIGKKKINNGTSIQVSLNEPSLYK